MYRYPDFPDQVYVELTNACNARCTICATPNMQRRRAIMSFDLFRKIIDECGRYRVRRILPFLHGETLLVPGVLDYFRYIRRASPGSHVNLTTNGSRLNADMTEAFLQENLLDSLIISVDGADKQTFEGIRLGLDFDEIRENVLYFMKRRNEQGKTTPKVSVAMVTVEENKHCRKQFEEVWRGVDEVRFSVYFNWAGKLENSERTPHKVNFCERIYHYITILADGRVAMCCFDSEAAYCVGDINRKSIYEVWHSDSFNQKRRWLYERNFNQLKLCGQCDYINHPAWTAPLVRIRPYIQRRLPGLGAAADRVYKKWLMK
ncbi:MAG TPA: radical SAM protein [Acidobacteriota bacterium]|nr:radical SAM protein [Acidobacteriota bacterium]